MENYSDEQLVVKYLKGEEKALDVLIKRYLLIFLKIIFQEKILWKKIKDLTRNKFFSKILNIILVNREEVDILKNLFPCFSNEIYFKLK